jgi:hypothetical protein
MSNQEFLRALNTYYSIKSEYEDNVYKLKKKIIDNKSLSWKEKNKEFRKMKPKCINCNRPVKTIFDIHFEKDMEARIAKAMCGDRTNPCPLNIELNLGSMKNIEDVLHVDEDRIREIRSNIIKDKNDLLFGYISAPDAVAKFDRIKEKMTDSNASYEIILDTYMSIVNNKQSKERIRILLLDTYADIKSCKSFVDKYEREQSVDFINDLVTMYITQLSPKLRELRQLIYPYCAVEKRDNECILIQRKMPIEEMELDMASEPQGVIQFVVGDQIQTSPASQRQPQSQPQSQQQSGRNPPPERQNASSSEIDFDDDVEQNEEVLEPEPEAEADAEAE